MTTAALCAALVIMTVTGVVGQDTAGSDVIGSYGLANAEQCRRLCAYRSLCRSYSVNGETRADNCVLYAAPTRDITALVGWVVEPANLAGIRNSCAERPCAHSEVCVPATNAHALPNHRCLSVPVDCGNPPTIAKASLSWNQTSQGHVATLTCDSLHEVSTSQASANLTCSVTSVWTPYGVTCLPVCENGGVRDADVCQCPAPFNGTHCEQEIPVDCGLPPQVAHGFVDAPGGSGFNDVATLTCDPYFDLTPQGSSELACGVTSRWTPSGVTCEMTCVNGGTRDKDVCLCPDRYNGTHCQEDVTCGAPLVDHGSFVVGGTGVSDMATLTCDPYFDLTPPGADLWTCDASSLWTPAGVTCNLRCENGGTRSGDVCLCPVTHAGTHCQRLIRDCTEPFELGYNSTDLNGDFFIQPIGAPQSFKVNCLFNWGGVTRPFGRKLQSYDSLTWATAKAGTSGWTSEDFFVGLDNMHYLSSQADYQVQVGWWGGPNGAGTFYGRFNIGDESSSYALTFDTWWGRTDLEENGFGEGLPRLFSTTDTDVNGCSASRGWAGWFGPRCEGTSLFAPTLTWPVDGGSFSAVALEVSFSRRSPFNDQGI